MKIGNRRQTPPHIPFIALADIAWQIIVFLIMVSAFIQKDALKVAFPGASNDPQKTSSSEISVAAAQSYLLINNSEKIQPAQLQGRLSQLLAGKKKEQDRIVKVSGHQNLTFQEHGEIMYAVQKAGGILVIEGEDAK